MKLLLVVLAALLALPTALPAAPATCADPCTITARSVGYVSPVATIASGSSVTFVTGDIGHITADGTGTAGAPACFVTGQLVGDAPIPVTFTIAGATLRASYQDENGRAHEAACGNAQALPGGAFALPFYCKIHANMRGLLVVTP